MSEVEKANQYKGFSVVHGHTGYLREAYHGSPYATRILVAEAFDTGKAKIPAAILRKRLKTVEEIAMDRQRIVYGEGKNSEDTKSVVQSFRDFVSLCQRKEREHGEPCTIVASY